MRSFHQHKTADSSVCKITRGAVGCHAVPLAKCQMPSYSLFCTPTICFGSSLRTQTLLDRGGQVHQTSEGDLPSHHPWSQLECEPPPAVGEGQSPSRSPCTISLRSSPLDTTEPSTGCKSTGNPSLEVELLMKWFGFSSSWCQASLGS